jgi:RNA polymerase sigma factor (sigma-70 family)
MTHTSERLRECRWRHADKWCFNGVILPADAGEDRLLPRTGEIAGLEPLNFDGLFRHFLGMGSKLRQCDATVGRCPFGNGAETVSPADPVALTYDSCTSLPSLLARARSGDKTALAAIMASYVRRLHRAARAWIGPALRADAEVQDLVQSVHLRLLPGLKTGKYNLADWGGLLALALGTLHNLLVDQWRRLERESEKREQVLMHAVADSRAEADPTGFVQTADSLAAFLAGLSAADRRLAELCAGGFSVAEIAQELGCGVDAVRSRQFRLRARLRERGCADLP